jgi:hypothetical protein
VGITDDPLWRAEFVPPTLEALAVAIRKAWGLGADAVGSKGDTHHTSGYHRSRNWVLGSRYSAKGASDYSVRYATDSQGGDGNWICALDVTPGDSARMIAACKRLDAALRAGQLPNVREFYGNTNGDQVVDGWDELLGKAVTSDDSHLWHFHISFRRSRAGNDHSDVLGVILGTGGGTTMTDSAMQTEIKDLRVAGTKPAGMGGPVDAIRFADYIGWTAGTLARIAATLDRIETKLDAPGSDTPAAPGDLAAVVDAMRGQTDRVLDALRAQATASAAAVPAASAG